MSDFNHQEFRDIFILLNIHLFEVKDVRLKFSLIVFVSFRVTNIRYSKSETFQDQDVNS